METIKKIIIFLVVTFKLFIYIINETIWNSSIVSYIFLMLIFLLSLPFIIKLSFNKKSFIKTFIILLIAFIMFILYKEDNIFLYAIVALLTLDNQDEEIVKIFFYSALIICGLTIVLGCSGILPMNDVYRTIEGATDIRISLGFPNANAVFSYILPLVLAGIYLFDKNSKFNLLTLIITTILFLFCKSRAGYYLVLICLGVNYLQKTKFIIKFSKNSFLIFFFISILLALLFGSTKYNLVNVLLSSRPWCYLNYLKLGPLVWGQGVPENLILDNLYFRLLANYHIVGFGLYYYIFYQGTRLCYKDQKILLATFFLLLYGVFEAVTVVNFVIVIFLKHLFIKYWEENNEKN